MTDNEIIKAFEACYTNKYTDCDECPYYCRKENRCVDMIVDGVPTLPQNILDLINRQQAEIERLKEYPKCVYEYDGDIVDYCLKSPCANYKTAEEIKIEALKKYAERLITERLAVIALKGKSNDFAEGFQSALEYVEEQANNLLKEMG